MIQKSPASLIAEHSASAASLELSDRIARLAKTNGVHDTTFAPMCN